MPSLALLGLASSLSVFGMAIIVPAIGGIAAHFDAAIADVQYVVSAYLFGLALSQPVCGYLADRFGRRRTMLTGFTLFIVASAGAVVAPSLPLLVAMRFLQAVGVSVGTVATRAILRDTRAGDKLAEAMSYVAVAMGVAPIIAPIFGGMLDAAIGYQSIFVLTALMGLLVVTSVFFHLDETLPDDYAARDVGRWLAGYAVLLRSASFVGYTLVFGFVQGTFFSFLAVGAPYFDSAFGIGSRQFGILWGALAVTYVFGAALGARLTPVIGAARVLRFGVLAGVAAGVLVVAVTWSGTVTPVRVLVPLGALMIVAGVVTPGALAGAVHDHPQRAGTASGLSSALGLVLGGVFTIISGSLYAGGFEPIALLMCGCTVATWLSWLLATRANQRDAS